MAKIEVTCPSCEGTHRLSEQEVRVVCFTQGGGDYYEFECGGCHERVRRAATDRIVYLLREGGVSCTVVERPAEACELHTGPPVSKDDVLDFMLALRGIDCPTEIIAP